MYNVIMLKSIKKILFILFGLIIFSNVFFIFQNRVFDGGILNPSSLVSSEENDYSSQNIALDEVDNYNLVLGENQIIRTTLLLPDDKVFFGGSNGNWAIQTIVDGKFTGNIISGNIGKYGFIDTAAITDDYESSSEIILGLYGYAAILNVETGVAEFPEGWKVGDNMGVVSYIQSIGNNQFLLYNKAKGNILKIDASDKGHSEVGKIDVGTYITSNYIIIDDKLLFGTIQGKIYEYDPNNDKTTQLNNFDVSAAIYTLTMINSTDCFIGSVNGGWWNYDVSTEKINTQGVWKTGEKTNPIFASVAIPDANNSEILASSSNGYWAIIDINKDIPEGNENIINSGYFEGKKNIENCVELSLGDSSTFLFAGSSKWTTANLVGSTSGFNKEIDPEIVKSLPNEIDYKITMLNDYPEWPINIEKYKIKSTITDESTNSDITSISTSFDQVGEIIVKINSLDPDKTYKDLRIQLMKNDGETPIGEEWDTNINLKTTIGRVKNINKVTLGDIASDGFKFTIDSFSSSAKDPENVSEYTLKLNAQKIDGVLGETTIWESDPLTKAANGTEYVVSGLDPGVKYEQVTIQANYNDTGLVGDPLKLSSEITTKNIPTKLSGKIGEKTNTSFELLANIEAQNSEKKITDGYYMHVKSKGLDYTSEISYDAGEDVSFIIGNLDPGESYDNLKISLSWDKEGEELIDGCDSLIDGVVVDNHISSIEVATAEEDSTSITINSTVSANNNDNPITSPFKIQVFNTFESIEEPIYETEDIQESGEINPINILNLTTETNYHLKLQLIEDSTKIGNLYDLGVVTTTSSKVLGFENVEILDDGITTHGFDVSTDIKSENDAINVERYKLVFYNGEKEKPVWYRESSLAGKQIFSVAGLSSSRTYDKAYFELWDSPNPDDHNVIATKNIEITTLGFVTTFTNESLKLSNVGQKSFDLSFNVEDTFKGSEQENKANKVEKYWVIIFANNNYDNPIYGELDPKKMDPEDAIQFSGQVNLSVKRLKSHTKFTNIKIQFIDEKGIPSFGNPQSTGLTIKTKMSIIMIGEIAIISLTLLGLIIFTIFWTLRTLNTKRKEEKENFTHHLRGF